ncbi:MAG TPA: hypothetical protein VNO31_42320 [Umezawaea sp.]|nr:hypothetical protein [Umezawaea sp.]
MKITVLLADFATPDVNNKVNALGLGWARTGTPLGVHSILLLVEASQDEQGVTHNLNIRLLNMDGNIVSDAQGGQLEINAEFTVEDQGNAPQVPNMVPLVVTLSAGMTLEPGVYRWEVTSPSFPGESWNRPFQVFSGSGEVLPEVTVPSGK